MRLVILGPPGSGKGTQSEFISEEYNIPVICTGDIIRKLAQSDKLIKDIINTGKLVSDERVESIIVEALNKDDIAEKGFILDGFPRTAHQAEFLSKYLKEHHTKLDAAILIDVEVSILVKRISSRRICKNCGAVYNLITNPPEKVGICNICGGELYQREDDKVDIVRSRVERYNKTIKEVIDYYRNLSLLKIVDGKGSIQEVYSIIIDELGEV